MSASGTFTKGFFGKLLRAGQERDLLLHLQVPASSTWSRWTRTWRAIRKFYEGKGFFDVRVDRKLIYSPDNSELEIDFVIDESNT